MNGEELAQFLRTRREALQPEDVGLPRGSRRRTAGLRREEVADLSSMSPDYYARLERGHGNQPSTQMVAALARGLRLSLVERDHLFALAGHIAPQRALRDDHVSPGLMRVLDRLKDTPAQIMGSLGETLVQTPLAAALLGEQTAYTGLDRSVVYRWFTDANSRDVYRRADHPHHGRVFTAQLRQAFVAQGDPSPAATLIKRLSAISPEFAAGWNEHEIGLEFEEQKHFVNNTVGPMELHCQTLLDPNRRQSLLVFTATPGTPSYERLALLAVVGTQTK